MVRTPALLLDAARPLIHFDQDFLARRESVFALTSSTIIPAVGSGTGMAVRVRAGRLAAVAKLRLEKR